MAPNSDPTKCKEVFLEENQLLSEIELADESKPLGRLDGIDLMENEIWLLQCPKDMNLTELENQKLKVPGRSNINTNEAVSMEFNEAKERLAIAYCNKKGRYALRLMPVRGTIVLRDRLKAAGAVTEEQAEECCSPAKRVPMPKGIRVRHPLFGAKYDGKIKLDKSTEDRLKKADTKTAQILKERLNQKCHTKLSVGFKKVGETHKKLISTIEINSADEDVEFVSEEKLKKKKKKNKRKQSGGSDVAHESSDLSKNKKANISGKELVSKDLQWLQKI